MSTTRPAVHDLQDLARKAARAARPRRRGPARAARLHLIDMLSRWGASGLALIAGVAVFIAVAAGRAYPLRAAAWGVMLLVALHVCRRLQKEFRAGAASAAQPFRWRANYTAGLSVVGAAFGAGAVLLAPAGAPPEMVLQTLALILAGALGAALLHAPHGRSAAALWIPAGACCLYAAWRSGAGGLAVAGALAAAVAGGACLFLVARTLRARAVRRFPRTALQRRGFDLEDYYVDEQDMPGAAAV